MGTAVAAESGTDLINRDTAPDSPSAEETIATNLGLTVTVVSGRTADAMSATDFAQYSVLTRTPESGERGGKLARSDPANPVPFARARRRRHGGGDR